MVSILQPFPAEQLLTIVLYPAGLYTAHAYSIIKAVEYNGKRFLRIRNPWGNSEWTGRWSDGSKEWTPQWVAALESLGHSFGDDGAFIMEYQDFLDTWTLVHRTRLFDPSWVVSSLWMNAKVRLPGMVWDYGDISCKFYIRFLESYTTETQSYLYQSPLRYLLHHPSLSSFQSWTIATREGS